ncbi:MAG: exodeoxyribonuclease VII small subunit [Clostridia bacterium]|nr:exodeoxyribonuclease VII small subunit [Clostridia bacterium]
MAVKDLEKQKFEDLMNTLDELVTDLEEGNGDLEESINKYSDAMQIVKVCNDKLTNAQESVNKILKDNGNLEDFDVED